ncbi:hypothetical protein OIU83_20480 [Flavobacterium sp. LS1R49]|uniref:Uncharacterized protein n=1 Tax=Flavobacterium shii TaxID=2987687 RepID=A0A9X2YXJ8_9FLAO|nr:hypothetical protein [Flavobacterium shii]MCV9930049.1 hypothetical protein [Flavobacterium shii]
MTRIKMNGLILTIISGVLILISCSSAKKDMLEYNYFNEKYFYNDSLKVGIDFDKDAEFIGVNNLKRRQVKQLLGKDKVSLENLFLVAEYKRRGFSIYFFFKNINGANNNFSSSEILNDSLSGTVLFKKQKGKRSIIGLIKSIGIVKNDHFIKVDEVDTLLKRISIDSFNVKKLSYFSIYKNYFSDNHPNDLYAHEKLSKAPLKDVGKNSVKFQLLSTVNSFMSNNKVYDSLINKYEKNRKNEFDLFVRSIFNKHNVYENDSVFDKMSQIAKENSIIILNEDHYYPKHRIFALEILDVLKKNGYKYLSMEAFNEDKGSDYVPSYKNGIYTSEPYFAHFIRKAKSLGFVIQGHESYKDNVDRELDQARNIMKIFEKDPNAKIFVYVGHSHIEKGNISKKWMAEYFKELTGVNPVTINQVAICADNDRELMLIPRSYFENNANVKSSADYFLINNIQPSLRKIYTGVIFRKIEIKGDSFNVGKEKEILVKVIDFDEFTLIKDLAIPIQSSLMKSNKGRIDLELPLGRFHVIMKTINNKTIYEDDIIVK